MSEKKYWIKLNKEFFNDQKIDFLLSQKNGSDYVVLYLKLCTEICNESGSLCSQFGEVIVPWNAEKITRDLKFFNFDTVVTSLELFQKIGLIYEDKDNILTISNYNEIVNTSSKWADYKKKNRTKQVEKLDNVQKMSNECQIDVKELSNNVPNSVQNLSNLEEKKEKKRK